MSEGHRRSIADLVGQMTLDEKASLTAGVDMWSTAGIPRLGIPPVRLFRLIKNLTADGYYTSRIGLIDELGYTGNTALASFPSCTISEH